jgi:hypothetical protein
MPFAITICNLFAWHSTFGYSNTLTDASWDSSLLHKALCGGSFYQCDFPFVIGGEAFFIYGC